MTKYFVVSKYEYTNNQRWIYITSNLMMHSDKIADLRAGKWVIAKTGTYKYAAKQFDSREAALADCENDRDFCGELKEMWFAP